MLPSRSKTDDSVFKTVILHKAHLVYLHNSCPPSQIICMCPIFAPWKRYGLRFNSGALYPDAWVLTGTSHPYLP